MRPDDDSPNPYDAADVDEVAAPVKPSLAAAVLAGAAVGAAVGGFVEWRTGMALTPLILPRGIGGLVVGGLIGGLFGRMVGRLSLAQFGLRQTQFKRQELMAELEEKRAELQRGESVKEHEQAD